VGHTVRLRFLTFLSHDVASRCAAHAGSAVYVPFGGSGEPSNLVPIVPTIITLKT
jgi:hypothetical protein